MSNLRQAIYERSVGHVKCHPATALTQAFRLALRLLRSSPFGLLFLLEPFYRMPFVHWLDFLNKPRTTAVLNGSKSTSAPLFFGRTKETGSGCKAFYPFRTEDYIFTAVRHFFTTVDYPQ